MSHTVKVTVEFRDPGALGAAVKALGGHVLGTGSHRLYQGSYNGFGFTLPGWRYPLVLESGGKLSFDDYNGMWGNRRDLDRLKAAYSLEAAKQAAEAQGWITEVQGDKLVIYHPSGGTLEVTSAGEVDALGFNGKGCAEAVSTIGAALGREGELTVKPEFYEAQQVLHATE